MTSLISQNTKLKTSMLPMKGSNALENCKDNNDYTIQIPVMKKF